MTHNPTHVEGKAPCSLGAAASSGLPLSHLDVCCCVLATGHFPSSRLYSSTDPYIRLLWEIHSHNTDPPTGNMWASMGRLEFSETGSLFL